MSTTITVKKAVAAGSGLVNSKHQVVYFLFEQAYDRNCHPHTPRWECCAVGVYEEVMRWVLRAADSCAGGMLQSRTGRIHPSNYVQAWRRAMEEPVQIDAHQKIYLTRGTNWNSSVPVSKVDQVGEYLGRLEARHLADVLMTGGTVPLGIQACLQIVVDLYGVGGMIGQPWRAIKHHMIDWAVGGDPELAPRRRTGSLQMPKFEAFTVSRLAPSSGPRDDIVVTADGGPFKTIRYESQAMSWCLDQFCYAAEMVRTGGTKPILHALSLAINQAKPLPDDMRVLVVRGQGSGTRFEEIAAELGLGQKTEFQTISVALGTLRDLNLLEALRAILPEDVRFERL